MTTISAYKARARLYQLIQEAADSHRPITIKGERSDAVLVSAADWASIQEALYSLSVPGTVESPH